MQKINFKNKKGSVILELLIAFAILTLNITAVLLLVNGGQSVYVDSETNNEAIKIAENNLENAKSAARKDFSSVVTREGDTETSGSLVYTKDLIISDLTPCKKKLTSAVSWPIHLQKVEFSTILTDIVGALAVGGDCPIDPPKSNWDSPERFASDTFNPGKPTSIDVLNKIAYLGRDKTPFFEIADTTNAILGQSDNLFVDFENSFDLGSYPNNIDVINWKNSLGENKVYAFLAMNTNSNQLKVVDVTDIRNPVLVSTQSLSSCVTGSYPQGWRLYVYKDRLYFLTRYTAGPEFHVFDISDPTSPTEMGTGQCKGFELGSTAENIEVRDQKINENIYRFVYLATDQNSQELRVLNVTNPLAIEDVNTASQNLPGNQDGDSVYIVGNKLYFGRLSNTSGPDFYIFNIKDPFSGLTIIGSQEIGTSVIAIRIAGSFGFLATEKTNKEFQVWNISNPDNIFLIKEYNFSNVINKGIDYEPDFVYVTGNSTPNFQILYDSTP